MTLMKCTQQCCRCVKLVGFVHAHQVVDRALRSIMPLERFPAACLCSGLFVILL